MLTFLNQNAHVPNATFLCLLMVTLLGNQGQNIESSAKYFMQTSLRSISANSANLILFLVKLLKRYFVLEKNCEKKYIEVKGAKEKV